MDDFGTQNTFSEFNKGTRNLREGVKIFGQSVGTWAAGVYAIKKLVGGERMKDLIERLTGREFNLTFRKILKEGIPIIGIKSITDTISELAVAIYNLERSLAREMGLTGVDRMNVLTKINREIQEGFDIAGTSIDRIYESYTALYNRFRDFTGPLQDRGMLAITAAMADRFGMAMEAAAEVSWQLNRSGFSPDQTEKMFNYFEGMNVSTQLIGEQIAGISDHMYKINLRSDEQIKRFQTMVGEAAKLGINLGKAMDTMDSLRNMSEAMQAAVEMSRWGLRVAPTQLMGAAMSADPMSALRPVLEQISKHTDPDGRLTHVGIQMADKLGPIIGMDRKEIADVMMRMQKNQLTIDEEVSFRKVQERSMRFQERFQRSVDRALFRLVPIFEKLLPIVEFLADHADKILIGILAVVSFMHLAWAKEKIILMAQLAKERWLASMALFRGGTPEAAAGEAMTRSERAMQQPRNIKGRFAKKGMGFPAAGQILATGAALIMFAGAMFILAKAYQEFNTVKLEGFIAGTAAMFAMIGAAAILSYFSPLALATSVALIALGGALYLSSMAFEKFSKALEPLLHADLIKLGVGLGAIGIGLGVLTAGKILSLFSTAGIFVFAAQIHLLGKVAERYTDPIVDLANAFDLMAASLERIERVSQGIKSIDFDEMTRKISRASNELHARRADLIGGTDTGVPLQNLIRIDIDGRKVADAIHMSTAGVRG